MNTIDYKLETGLKFINEIGKIFESRFKIDEDNEDVINNLILYFTGNQGKYDITKGLFLHGEIGCGKTLLFKIFRQFTNTILRQNSFQFVSARGIVKNFLIEGMSGLDKYSYNFQNERKIMTYCFDDVGVESISSKHYGSELNVVAEILLDRYDILKNYGKFTHITSNLTVSNLEKIYGNRVRSRLNEMFNDIYLKGSDRRRRK